MSNGTSSTPGSVAAFQWALDHHRAGRLAEAEAAYRQILSVAPHHADSLHLLGMLHQQQGDNAAAERLMRQALDLRPDVAHFHANLGGILGIAGRPLEAIESLRSAIRLKPEWAEAHNNLGVALEQSEQFDEAIAAYRQAIVLRPGHPEAHKNLGNALRLVGRLDQAQSAYLQSIRLAPHLPGAFSGLAISFSEQGKFDEALNCYRSRVERWPDDHVAHSDLLLHLLYDERLKPAALFEEHRQWAKRHARWHAPPIASHAIQRTRDQPLRIGYISPDFREHPAARYIEPILRRHDRQEFHVICYADQARSDAVTDRIRAIADIWRQINGVDDDRVEALIRADKIDILVDLAGHMGSRRMSVIARKLAPVQISYLYPFTTGVAAVDYRFTHELLDPPGHTEALHTERLIRLPESCWCIDPGPEDPPCNDLPAASGRSLTFGSLNRIAKIQPGMIRLWARLLKELPDSRLLVLASNAAQGQSALAHFFASNGIDARRLLLTTGRCRHDYLRLYHEVDIALDTFPYHGQTTTFDSLWMGVPVVTLAGNASFSRSSLPLLSAVGLIHLAASTPEQYLQIAVRLGRDLPKLQALRASLRERLRCSPIMDFSGMTRRIEHAYRNAWLARSVVGRDP